ncbi:ABC transporter substrate-binding protein [Allostreptomyces psammosilenae]|uniref:Multiple sugar transport system substrate-binding protein n=1 Tax=Allostreptomyces psammosilenae TaxID=1892865 RepID=A0A853A8Q5_9ACTN|nr:extracellular solute-binding protein [Allostreptomyces psammosilenae]NYI06908.1 multiple sugar transport system substrate-binding protein [Allostreptomyces psammosilenae]
MKLIGIRIAALTTSAALLAAGCSVGAGEDRTELTFWSWAPNIDQVVEIWNAEHPDVHVTVSKQAAGDELVTKLLTASGAGNPPDLAQVEYQALPNLASNGALADISGYVGDLGENFADGVWQQVTLGTDAVYGVPQDAAPMMLYYRQDLFAEHGLQVPTTWEEFGEVARQVRQIDPDAYLTTFSSTDPGAFAGLTQQAGAEWWSIEGESWRIGVDDEATVKVAEFWDQLVTEDAVDDVPMFTPEWNSGMGNGTYWSWPSAVWAPGNLASIAADNAGDWAAAPLPQWEGTAPATGSWGGSSTGVMAGSEHQAEAAEFAAWLNTDPVAVSALVEQAGIYPADQAAQQALEEPPAYFSNQPDYYELASEVADTTAGVTWGPNVNVAYNAFKDAFGSAITRRTPFADAARAMQDAVFRNMADDGFSVNQ